MLKACTLLVILSLLATYGYGLGNSTTPVLTVDITNDAAQTMYFLSYSTNSTQVDSVIDTSDIDPNSTYEVLYYLPLGNTTWYLNITYVQNGTDYYSYYIDYTYTKASSGTQTLNTASTNRLDRLQSNTLNNIKMGYSSFAANPVNSTNKCPKLQGPISSSFSYFNDPGC